jgi:hypothetical protein
MQIKNQIIVHITLLFVIVCFRNKLTHNNTLIFETWKQKLMTMIATVTVGGDIATMAMKVRIQFVVRVCHKQ